MRYYLFLDESGEASIANPDPRFNTFVLCGILFREDHYKQFDTDLKQLKGDVFGNDSIVFHSFEMRKQSGDFVVFKDKNVLATFYQRIEPIFTKQTYTIIACIVDKEQYKERYPEKNQAYEDALKFICERAISCIGDESAKNKLHICLEKRQKRKDAYLKKYYTSFRRYGTDYCSTAKFQICAPELYFRGKHQKINGLEFADLCAYPIARKALHPEIAQPTYDLFYNKIYCSRFGDTKGFGLKHFP